MTKNDIDIKRLTEISERWERTRKYYGDKPPFGVTHCREALDALPLLLREHELLKRCATALDAMVDDDRPCGGHDEWYCVQSAEDWRVATALLADLRAAGVLE